MKEACLKLTGEGLGHALPTALADSSFRYETVVSSDGRYVWTVASAF